MADTSLKEELDIFDFFENFLMKLGSSTQSWWYYSYTKTRNRHVQRREIKTLSLFSPGAT